MKNENVNMIEVCNLTKDYGNVLAVDNISFTVQSGEIYGLLGPNGAGKTTTLKVVTGVLEPTKGDVYVLGKSPFEDPITVKNLIGYVPEEINLFESLSIREFFEFIGSVRRVPPGIALARISSLIKAFDIEKYFETPIATLSMGTKQKVAIIAALLHDPQVLVLDEPLVNLDVRSAKIVKEIITYHIANGGAVLFSTHIMDIAEKMCTRVGIINDGKIIAEGTVNELRQMFKSGDETLEEIFLKVTHQDESVEEVLRTIKEAFD